MAVLRRSARFPGALTSNHQECHSASISNSPMVFSTLARLRSWGRSDNPAVGRAGERLPGSSNAGIGRVGGSGRASCLRTIANPSST